MLLFYVPIIGLLGRKLWELGNDNRKKVYTNKQIHTSLFCHLQEWYTSG